MPNVLRLRIRPVLVGASASGGASDVPWKVSLDDLRSRPTVATVDPEEVRRARTALTVSGGVQRAEAAAAGRGRALATLVAQDSALLNHLAFLLGPETGVTGRPVLAVDAVGEAGDWPWEDLAATPETAPLERTRRAVVARVVPGPSQPERTTVGHAVRVVHWCPVPGEAQNAARVTALIRHLTALTQDDALAFGSAMETPPPPDRPVSTVLHIVVGAQTDVIGHIVGDAAGAQAGGTWLRGVDLVVLDVAADGPQEDGAAQEWAKRLVAAGAPACIAPTGAVGSAAAQRFNEVFYGQLVDQRTVAEAAAEARREAKAIQGAGGVYALWVADPEVLARGAFIERRWHPVGWPTASAAAAEHLHAARALAQRSGLGFVGLEHLALALVELTQPSPVAALVRRALAPRVEALRQRLAALVPSEDRALRQRPDDQGTARLSGYGDALMAGFDLDDLWELVARDPDHHLHEIAGQSLALALSSGERSGAGDLLTQNLTPYKPKVAPVGDAILVLQVAGGPEDGRLLRPLPGDVLGRWSDRTSLALALYEETPCVDRRLSRRHLKWLGDGRALMARRVRVRRGGSEIVYPAGEVLLQVGDLVRLSRGTRVRVLARSPSDG